MIVDEPHNYGSRLTTFADELERGKARQRTAGCDGLQGAPGHVTGGRVFGYDNVRTPAGHVERQINNAEAAVVRASSSCAPAAAARLQLRSA